MYNGVINVYKEQGFTSHDVVAKLRGILKMKKIGHTGTLDPDAVGVLPVCLGNGTKVSDMLTDKSKEYIAVLRLGITTDTQAMSGTVLCDKTSGLSLLEESSVTDTIKSFEGESMQIPPMYSALKVNGQKLYDLARKGIEVTREPRKINIFDIEIIDENESKKLLEDNGFTPDILEENGIYVIKVHCSKGTYIRTLCNDIGEKLGVGGVMQHLIRSRVGCFLYENAFTLNQIQSLAESEKVSDIITPVDVLFDEYPKLRVREEAMKALLNGNQLKPDSVTDFDDDYLSLNPEKYNGFRVYSFDGKFTGVYSSEEKYRIFTPVKMFL